MSPIDVTLGEVAASVALVAVAAAISFWLRAGLEEDIGIALVRSFIQLTAIGFVIQAIFDEDSLLLVAALLVVVLGIFEPEPRFLVPVGGMVIGNAMTAAAVSLNRLGDEMRSSARQIEATLALGATSTEAALPIVRRSLRSGMIPLVDSTKTTGLIFFPGTMVGMLLAGADPIDAVRLQLVLLYTLLGSVAVAAVVATSLAYRSFFTPAHQLRDQPSP